MTESPPALPPERERALLWLMAGLQFSHLLDFMILPPLAPQFMRLWSVDAGRFGWLVSVYALAAFAAGLAAALFIDRFSRRRALTVVYALFVVSTIACALAPGFWSLLAARALAGASGGVTGSLVMAIIGDSIPAERRGRAMGVVMSAFPVVSVLGVPLSLALATRWSWHVPFVVLGVLSAALWLGIRVVVPEGRAAARAGGPLTAFGDLFRDPTHLRALLAVFAFTLSGFALFPYLSAYHVKNVGISEAELAWVFFAGGFATLFTSRLIGWCADHYGKRRVFLLLAWISIVPILVSTHMPRTGLWLLIATTTPFMVFMSGRFIPLMALVTTCVRPAVRGAFMSLSSATQNLASGLASLLAGAMLGQDAGGALTGFGTVGFASVACTLVCIAVAHGLHPLDGAPQAGTGGVAR